MNSGKIIQKLSDMLSNRCTLRTITSLGPKEVFVFGSKPNGHHKSGVAKIALERYEAEEGKDNDFSGKQGC